MGLKLISFRQLGSILYNCFASPLVVGVHGVGVLIMCSASYKFQYVALFSKERLRAGFGILDRALSGISA
jgi:hypothetical protein